MLGQMSAVLAHEIKNPLASLKGHAQLLVEQLGAVGPSVAPSPARSKAERVVAEAIRLERLISALLELVRTGRIDRRPADPRRVLEAAANEVDCARIRIDAVSAPASWSIDPDRLQQALANVLRNAVEASPDESLVALRVATEHGQLVYEIHDAGPGLAPGSEQRIFEPFHTGKAHGTGLGLAVAKRIVELHDGTIAAVNDPRGGALFRIVIPGAPQVAA